MNLRSKFRFPLLLLSVIGLVSASSLVIPGLAQQEKSKAKSSQEKKYVPPADASQYVGAETCKTCHEDMPSKGFYKTYEDSPHYATMPDTKKGPEWHGCEACHGPGKEHVDGGGDKSKIFTFKNASAKEISERCCTTSMKRQEQLRVISILISSWIGAMAFG